MPDFNIIMMKLEENLQKLNELFELKCLFHIRRIDRHIQRNLLDGGYETRKVKSNGLWSCSLIPIILAIYSLTHQTSTTYKLVSCISIGLLSYSILFIIFMVVSCLILRDNICAGCVATGMVSAFLMIFLVGEDVTTSLLIAFSSSSLYTWLLRTAIVKFPRTFSIGEAMVVTQIITLLTATFVLMVISKESVNDETKVINSCILSEYAAVGLIIIILSILKEEQRTLRNLLLTFLVAFLLFCECLHIFLGLYSIPEIYNFIFNDSLRVTIIVFWVFILAFTIVMLCIRTSMKIKASTVTRKFFHIMASFVFISGIVCDIELMRLAAGIGLGVLVLTEALRKCNIEPISSTLEKAFLVYSDDKDSGSFAMTPIYLFVGLSCPLVLIPAPAAALDSLAGVLAIGVGDTAASWFGFKYGNIKWPGQSKTVEGSVFNVLSQVATVYALQVFELLDDRWPLARTMFAATVSAAVEAKTDQVDNLVLPFVSLIAFQISLLFL